MDEQEKTAALQEIYEAAFNDEYEKMAKLDISGTAKRVAEKAREYMAKGKQKAGEMYAKGKEGAGKAYAAGKEKAKAGAETYAQSFRNLGTGLKGAYGAATMKNVGGTGAFGVGGKATVKQKLRATAQELKDTALKSKAALGTIGGAGVLGTGGTYLATRD